MTGSKRSKDEESDGDIGPSLPHPSVQKKQRNGMQAMEQSQYLARLPNTAMYELSLMHRDTVNLVVVAHDTDFVITTSIDGHVKFWKKQDLRTIEFVKHFRAHLGAIIDTSLTSDGLLFATCGADKAIKVFDVVNFDMINMFKLDFLPLSLCWVFPPSSHSFLLACADKLSNKVHFFNGREGTGLLYSIPASSVSSNASQGDTFASNPIHNHPVHLMRYNPLANIVVSIDDSGMAEYWSPDPQSQSYSLPSLSLSWTYKSETDLYCFKKLNTVPTSLQFSKDYSMFATFGFDDRQIRIFNFKTAKITRTYDESLSIVSEMQQAGTSAHKLDDMEFGRRLALEREIGAKQAGGQSNTANVIFDDSGHFILYPTLIGVKVVNIVTNKLVRLIAKEETNRFMNLALYQGTPKKKGVTTLAMAASDNPVYKETELIDPTLFCTAYKKNRFFAFTRREPDAEDSFANSGSVTSSRDVYNEKPSREEQTLAAASATQQTIGSQAVIHTSFGDINVKLFPEYAPKAVENFIQLSTRGYYDNTIFHRVIKGFMLQTGDPLGDGTGGESCWAKDFEDEFHKSVKHDRPYTLSMANCGPNTNASQFFITVAPTPWLDNKHSIFGRATAGMDVIHRIENAKTDKNDVPLDTISILGIEIR